MTGLPAVPSSRKPRPVWERMTLQPIERMTEWVMSGAAISGDELADMKDLCRRTAALARAIEAREALVENDE